MVVDLFTKHRILIAGSALLLCLFLVSIYVYINPPDVVITRTADGFVPQKVIIKKGQAIVFKSDAGKEFWPASDSHPTHRIYPEFDPKQPVPPTGEWRFVFDKAGVWIFHDHLSSDIKGTVIVTGAPGESTATCLSSNAVSNKSTCWEGDIIDTLQKKGLAAALDLFRSFYDSSPEFRGLNCHDAGHILGTAAYKAYASDHTAIDRPETSYCGYGFYHGFMEAMLLDKGPGQFKEVREYCESLNANGSLNNASGACFHGIGHATFDSLRGELWGNDEKMVAQGLETCEEILIDKAEQAQCGTGVFNSLAIAYSAHSYRLSFRATDPMSICRAQKPEYQKGCYGEVGIGVIREKHMERAAAIQFINSNGSSAVSTMLFAYAGDETKRSKDLVDLYHMCSLWTSPEMQAACMRGVIAGIREGGGEPGKEYEAAFRFCAPYPEGTTRTDCFALAVSQTKTIASDKGAFKRACLAISDVDMRDSCD